MKSVVSIGVWLGLLGATIAPAVCAEPINGQLQIAGSFALSSAGIDFLPAGAPTGSFAISSGTGSFATYVGGSGAIRDLAFVMTNQPSFLTFTAHADTRLDLMGLSLGIYGSASCLTPAATGQVCTPVGSVLNFANLSATMSTLSFAGLGSFINGIDSVPYVANFMATFAAIPYQVVLATLNGGGTVTASYSASFAPIAAPVPEPETYVLLIVGLAVLGKRLAADVSRRRTSDGP